MKLEKIIPLLYSLDLNATVHFYTTHLGFMVNEWNESLQWVSLSNGDIELMFSSPVEGANTGNPHFTGSFYFRVQDAAALWAALTELAVTPPISICYPLETFDWGMQEFAIYDNNGYVLQFGTPV